MKNSGKALVVEDDLDMCELLQELLEMEGYTVEIEHEGQAGFRRATTGSFKLLVVDINLPGWNGVDMLNSLALVGTTPKVVVVTGGVAAKITAQLNHSLVAGVLQKPFDLEEFRGLVRPGQ